MGISLAEKPWLKSYDKGVPHTIDVQESPLHKLLENSAAKYPDHTALIFKGKKISYRELNELTDLIAASLAANGFVKGDRAVIYMPNTPQFVVTYYGILKAGGIVIATNPLYTERELKHQLKDCGAETVFVLSMFYDNLKRVQRSGETKVKRVIVTNIKEYLPTHLRILFTLFKEKKEGHYVKELEPGDVWYQDFLAAGRRAPKVNVDVKGSDIALLQYTGGTTDLSKGSIGLHRSMASNTEMARVWLHNPAPGTQTILTAIPLFHSYGMVAAMNFGMLVAGTLVLIPNPRDQDDLLGSINKYRPTLFPGVPAMYVAINNNPDVVAGKYDISSIRMCLSGSAPLLLETKQRFEELTGGTLVEAYGLTEAHVATHANPMVGDNRPGSIGLPLPLIECRIVDVDSGKELGTGEIGELLIKGPNIMEGYWNMEEETAKTLQDGWLFTGDVVECDEDGYFYIRDRKKDMIIAGGFNVYPREVEDVLATHQKAVLEVAVAGVPDAKRGETVKAWIVRKPGVSATEDEIIEWSKELLAKYKYPRLIEFRDELPKSTVLKVLKRELVREHIEKNK